MKILFQPKTVLPVTTQSAVRVKGYGDYSSFPHQMMSTDTGHHEKVRIHRPESWRRCSHPACSLEAFGTVQIWSYRNHFFFFCFIVAFHCFVFLEKSHGCNEAQAGINLSANFSCLPNIQRKIVGVAAHNHLNLINHTFGMIAHTSICCKSHCETLLYLKPQ